MRLGHLTDGITIKEIYAPNGSGTEVFDTEIKALTIDGRLCRGGELFICLSGGETDSHAFAKQALNNGAVALVCERRLPLSVPQVIVENSREATGFFASKFYGEPSKKLKIIGITGTNGKTTVSYMLSSILKAAGKSVGVIGTLGIAYANKRVAPELTTPDPVFLHEIFADMVTSGVEYAVMEVSAHAQHYNKIAGIPFTACIFTNFSQDHLDFFKTMEAYKTAKIGLFDGRICPLAIVNGDDAVGVEIARNRRNDESVKTVTYGLEDPADAFAVITHESLYGSEFLMNINDELCRATLSMTGLHNVYNALAAATCCKYLGVSALEIREGLKTLNGVTGRLEYVDAFQGADVFVDFAHTPDGLEKSLSALKKHCKGRVICLFGCGGNRDKSKRAAMGETVAKKADFAVLTSDNPRYEDPLDIISEIERGYRRYSVRYVVVPDREKAIDYALDLLKKGDALLVAGKGGEDYQEIMGIKYHFNDNDIIKKLMERKRENPFV